MKGAHLHGLFTFAASDRDRQWKTGYMGHRSLSQPGGNEDIERSLARNRRDERCAPSWPLHIRGFRSGSAVEDWVHGSSFAESTWWERRYRAFAGPESAR